MAMIDKCKDAYINARPFEKQRVRQVSGIVLGPRELAVHATRRLFDKWDEAGLPPEVPTIFGFAAAPVVKHPVPVAPGFYWAKHLNPSSEKLDGRRQWEAVEVFRTEDIDERSPLGVYVLCHERSCELDEFFWGPRIEEPR